MEQDFPITTFLEIKKQLHTACDNLEKEKAVWRTVRHSRTDAEIQQLDEQFRTVFESLQKYDNRISVNNQRQILQSLTQLVREGAAATLLQNYELGTYNLAMLVSYLEDISDEEGLDLAIEIIRITIIADADLYAQKAYIGNGGINALGWLCIFLAGGVDKPFSSLSTIVQYQCCCKIFPWVVYQTMAFGKEYVSVHPFDDFMRSLRWSPEVADLQEKVILQLICFGWTPVTGIATSSMPSFFINIAIVNLQWLTMLFPYEQEPLKSYIDAVQKNMDAITIKHFLNSFTSNNKTRKHFRAFFSKRPHWLLKHIIASAPELIFTLVRRNEQDMLTPFLKLYKKEMAAIRDDNNRGLLQHAVESRGVVENTRLLVRQAKLSTT